MTHGIVSLAALDLRRRPDHRSELGSQLLMGEVVRFLRGRSNGWRQIENLGDRYRGWVRTWGIVPVSAGRAGRWRLRAVARVALPFAEVREGRGRGALVTPVFWGSRLIPASRSGAYRRVGLPDGRRGWIRARALGVTNRPPGLAERIRALLGVPYLWGGRTPAGLDCSAFTQLVLLEQGIGLPRDAAEQERSTIPLESGTHPEPGDLVFFGRPGRPAEHVGLALGGSYFAHSRGRVRINSLESNNPLSDKILNAQFRGWRRVKTGRRRSAARGPADAHSC